MIMSAEGFYGWEVKEREFDSRVHGKPLKEEREKKRDGASVRKESVTKDPYKVIPSEPPFKR